MTKKKKKKSSALASFVVIILLAFGIAGGFAAYTDVTEPDKSDVLVSGNLEIHFLELGNKYTGDCTYINAGGVDILIDAGSKTSSIPTISAYLNEYVDDGILEYVIVTHAHQDHYAGFATSENTDSLFDLFECKTIIDFSQTNQKSTAKMYNNYLRELADEVANGATHYTAEECMTQGLNVFALGDDIELEILDSYYYYNKASSGENDHSVCCMINQGDNHFLFTGDLEKSGEEKLVEMNDLPQVVLYKAGHHGSKTSSHDVLLSVIQPEIVCVCCCAGSSEYTDTNENQFPTQEFIDRIAPYTERVYVTTRCINYDNNEFASMNGNIKIISNATGISVVCSNSDLILKEWEWFRQNRTCPSAWAK